MRRAIRLRTWATWNALAFWLLGECMHVPSQLLAGRYQTDLTDRRQMTRSLPGACLVDMWIVARVWGK
jgi:hypothetical protein